MIQNGQNVEKVEKYITELFGPYTPYILSDSEKKIAIRDTVGFMTQKLFRKRFRKQKLHPDTIADITNKLKQSIKENTPIYFTIPFGGYKHFWNDSHPSPDWAELFTLKFLTDWVYPLLAVYKPGVIIEFISEDMILPRMNNYPDETLDTYTKNFQELLDVYKKCLPKNLEIRFFRVGDRCNKAAIIFAIEALLPERWEAWKAYTQEQKEIELKRSRRAIMWQGVIDLTRLSEEEKEKRIIESRLIELAYYDVEAKKEFLGDYYTEKNRIPICFSFGLSPDNGTHWITLGSTYASIVDYWIGRGILEINGDTCMPRIVSKEQYEKIKPFLTTQVLDPQSLPSKNYQSIEIISSQDWLKSFS